MTRIADVLGALLRRNRRPAPGPAARAAPDRALPVLVLPAPPPRHDEVTPAMVRAAQRRAAQPLAAPLDEKEAARRFVAWLREVYPGEHPWSGDAGIWAYYLEHCQCERLTPIADNTLGEALGVLCKRASSGISKRLVNVWVESGGERIRKRPTYYTVAPLAPEAAAPAAGQRLTAAA